MCVEWLGTTGILNVLRALPPDTEGKKIQYWTDISNPLFSALSPTYRNPLWDLILPVLQGGPACPPGKRRTTVRHTVLSPFSKPTRLGFSKMKSQLPRDSNKE